MLDERRREAARLGRDRRHPPALTRGHRNCLGDQAKAATRISTRLKAPGLRKALLGVGCLLFAGTVAWIATLPVNVEI
jgi:hypothetical protein